MRANRDYSLIPSADTLRIAMFGDSFVFCDDEKNEDAWEYFLENSVSNLEVLNFGVSGFGLGQSYLRYLKDGLKFQPDIIFFSFIETGSRDFLDARMFVRDTNLRNSYIYRVQFWEDENILKNRSVTPFDLFDPNFRKKYLFEPLGVNGKEFLLAKNFLSHLNLGLFLKQNLAKKRYNNKLKEIKSDQYDLERINIMILENLLQTIVKNQSKIIFFCSKPFLKLPQKIQNLLNDYKASVLYVQSTAALEEQFQQHNVQAGDLKNSSDHYNAQGNKLYAQAVLEVLKSRPWPARGKIFSFNEEKNAFLGVE